MIERREFFTTFNLLNERSPSATDTGSSVENPEHDANVRKKTFKLLLEDLVE